MFFLLFIILFKILLSWIDEAGQSLKLTFTFNEDWKVSGNKYYSIY